MQLDKCMNMDSKNNSTSLVVVMVLVRLRHLILCCRMFWNCKEFVNADEIARGLSPFNPESMAIEAGRLMLQRIK